MITANYSLICKLRASPVTLAFQVPMLLGFSLYNICDLVS